MPKLVLLNRSVSPKLQIPAQSQPDFGLLCYLEFYKFFETKSDDFRIFLNTEFFNLGIGGGYR